MAMKPKQLFQRLALRFQMQTDCTEAKAHHHTQRYLWQCGLEMMAMHFHQSAGSDYYINVTALQNTLNTIMVQGKRYYVWKVMQSAPERVFDIIQTGSNLTEEFTMARAKHDLETVILASGTPEELWQEIYGRFAQEIQMGAYDTVPIDITSLENFIRDNLSRDRDDPTVKSELRDRWDENLKHAQRILMLARASEGTLIQVHSDSAFGRRYYQGPNLQTVTKEVRHASLGDCHEYDIENSVFAWKLSWFRDICREAEETIAMPATLEYLDHKRAIRERLARQVFDTDAQWARTVIKQAITAIGFGAPLLSRGYRVNNRYQAPALATIITSRDRLQRFRDDAWVTEFVREQDDINTVIMGYNRLLDQEVIWRQVPELLDSAGRLQSNSVIAYLYQQQERKILDWIMEFCEPSQVLLTVHDCIYTRRPVKLQAFREGIRAFGEFFDVSHEQHNSWARDRSDELRHREFIQQEEQRVAAQLGITPGRWTTPGVKPRPRPDREWSGGGDGYTGAGHTGNTYDIDWDPAVEDAESYRKFREKALGQ